MHAQLRAGLLEVGEVAKRDAATRFEEWGPENAGTHAATAAGFRVRIRAGGRVEIEQSLPRTTGQHPEYGALMMTKALLPARDATHDAAVDILEAHVVRPLHDAGF